MPLAPFLIYLIIVFLEYLVLSKNQILKNISEQTTKKLKISQNKVYLL